MKIGIIGAENSHAAAIAATVNIQKKFKGVSVDYLWGETDEFAAKTAKAGAIPKIVKRPRDMLRNVDAVIVDHRHPKFHLAAALPFVKAGLPVFVDKPFCSQSAKGKEFLKTARKCGAAVTSFSVVPHQQSFVKFCDKLAPLGHIVAGETHGPCDLRSPYGGVFFYGIHQVDMALHAFGYNVSRVLLTRNGNGAAGQLIYSDGKIITMNLLKDGAPGFGISAVGDGGIAQQRVVFDKNAYLAGIRVFIDMFRTGKEPLTWEKMVRPVQVLEALQASLASGKVEKISR